MLVCFHNFSLTFPFSIFQATEKIMSCFNILSFNVFSDGIFLLFSGINSMQVVNIKWSGVLSWGYPDGVLRLKHKAKQSPINLIQTDAYHEVGSQ